MILISRQRRSNISPHPIDQKLNQSKIKSTSYESHRQSPNYRNPNWGTTDKSVRSSAVSISELQNSGESPRYLDDKNAKHKNNDSLQITRAMFCCLHSFIGVDVRVIINLECDRPSNTPALEVYCLAPSGQRCGGIPSDNRGSGVENGGRDQSLDDLTVYPVIS